MPTFEIETKTSDPAGAIGDIGCSLERLEALLDSNNADLHEAAIDRDTGDKWLTNNLYNRWMIYLLATEKLQEVRQMVHAAEEALLSIGHVPARKRAKVETPQWRTGIVYTAEIDTRPWDAALAAYRETVEATAAVCAATPEDDAAIDAATDVQTEALENLLHHRAPNAEAIIEKMRIIDSEGYHSNALAWSTIVDDALVLRGFIERTSESPLPSVDQHLLDLHAKWQRVRTEHYALDDQPEKDAEQAALGEEADRLERLIESANARTPRGIAARLELVFTHSNQDRAVDRVLCEHGVDFLATRDDLPIDGYERQLIKAIQEVCALQA